MRHAIMLALLCTLAACKTNQPPPASPPPGGVNVDAPFVHIRSGSPTPVSVDVPNAPAR